VVDISLINLSICRLKVFEKRVLRRVLGVKEEGIDRKNDKPAMKISMIHIPLQ
jgi:hypothetical protein